MIRQILSTVLSLGKLNTQYLDQAEWAAKSRTYLPDEFAPAFILLILGRCGSFATRRSRSGSPTLRER